MGSAVYRLRNSQRKRSQFRKPTVKGKNLRKVVVTLSDSLREGDVNKEHKKIS
jgi:hypothetical protein